MRVEAPVFKLQLRPRRWVLDGKLIWAETRCSQSVKGVSQSSLARGGMEEARLSALSQTPSWTGLRRVSHGLDCRIEAIRQIGGLGRDRQGGGSRDEPSVRCRRVGFLVCALDLAVSSSVAVHFVDCCVLSLVAVLVLCLLHGALSLAATRSFAGFC